MSVRRFVLGTGFLFGPVIGYMYSVQRGLDPLAMSVVWLMLALAAGSAVERIWPLQPRPPMSVRARVWELAEQVLLGPLYTLGTVLAWWWAGQAFEVAAWPVTLPAWAQALAVLALIDLGAYFMHRWMHEFGNNLGWRIHSSHHSIRFFDLISGARLHPLDQFLMVGPWCGLCGLLGASYGVTVAGSTLFFLMAMPTHWNVDSTVGPLKWIFSDVEAHRWHHSTQYSEAKNYAGVFAFWDALFGTLHFPRPFVGVIGIDSLPEYPEDLWTRWRMVSKKVYGRVERDQPR